MALINRKLSSETYIVEDGASLSGDGDKLSYFYGGDDKFLGDNGADTYFAYGDAYVMSGSSRGGKDTFYGGAGVNGGSSELSVSSIGFDGTPGVHFAGDADTMIGNALGGADTIYGGVNSVNILAGDAMGAMFDQARGGADRIEGGDAVYADGYSATNILVGDGYAMGVEGFGDTSVATLIGDTHTPIGGKDVIIGGDALAGDDGANVLNSMMGDGYIMGSFSRGGNDAMSGGSAVSTDGEAQALNVMMGDAYVMFDASVAGADTMRGGNATVSGEGSSVVQNVMLGDAYYFGSEGAAGNDVMFGGNAAGGSDGYAVVLNLMAGDAYYDAGAGQIFGNDKMTGGNGSGDGYAINFMFGDVMNSSNSDSLGLGALTDLPHGVESLIASAAATLEAMAASFDVSSISHTELVEAPSIYGDDILTGGTGALNELIGDANELGYGDVGGNDVLVGAANAFSILVGDAVYMYEGSMGGDDTLVSGRGQDYMYGDGYSVADGQGGADRFVFLKHNGNDAVFDFHESEGDKIDLSAFHLQLDMNSFAALQASGRIEDAEGSVLLHLNLNNPGSETDTVVIVGVSVEDLHANDFIF